MDPDTPNPDSPGRDFATACRGYEPFADPAACIDMADDEYEAWQRDQQRAVGALSAAPACSPSELALKLELALTLFDANALAEGSTLTEPEAELLRSCQRDAWRMATQALGLDRHPALGGAAPPAPSPRPWCEALPAQRAREASAASARAQARARLLFERVGGAAGIAGGAPDGLPRP